MEYHPYNYRDFTKVITPKTTSFIWSATPTGCALRRIVLHIYASCVSYEAEPHMHDFHSGFVRELALTLARRIVRDQFWPLIWYGCLFHDHEKGRTRCEYEDE